MYTVVGIKDTDNIILGENLTLKKANKIIDQYLDHYDVIEVIKDLPKPALVKVIKKE